MLAAPSWSPENIKVKELQTQLLAVRTSVICALNQLLDLKDLNTGVHSTRLAEWAVRIGRDLGLDDDCLRDLEAAAILHDIGKIGTPDNILRKPSKLTEAEYAIIKKHPEYGWAVLRAVPGFERVSLFVLHHHEAFDGSGYPAGLQRRRDPDRLAHRLGDGLVRRDGLIASVSQGPAARGGRSPASGGHRHPVRSGGDAEVHRDGAERCIDGVRCDRRQPGFCPLEGLRAKASGIRAGPGLRPKP